MGPFQFFLTHRIDDERDLEFSFGIHGNTLYLRFDQAKRRLKFS